MLRLTKKVEYAIIALRYFSISNDELLSAKVISEKTSINYDLLAKILQQLSKNGIIASVPGSRGGYTLIKRPANISLKNVIESVEGPIHFTDCMNPGEKNNTCDQVADCCIRDSLEKIHSDLKEYFSSITIQDIIETSKNAVTALRE